MNAAYITRFLLRLHVGRARLSCRMWNGAASLYQLTPHLSLVVSFYFPYICHDSSLWKISGHWCQQTTEFPTSPHVNSYYLSIKNWAPNKIQQVKKIGAEVRVRPCVTMAVPIFWIAGRCAVKPSFPRAVVVRGFLITWTVLGRVLDGPLPRPWRRLEQRSASGSG